MICSPSNRDNDEELQLWGLRMLSFKCAKTEGKIVSFKLMDDTIHIDMVIHPAKNFDFQKETVSLTFTPSYHEALRYVEDAFKNQEEVMLNYRYQPEVFMAKIVGCARLNDEELPDVRLTFKPL